MKIQKAEAFSGCAGHHLRADQVGFKGDLRVHLVRSIPLGPRMRGWGRDLMAAHMSSGCFWSVACFTGVPAKNGMHPQSARGGHRERQQRRLRQAGNAAKAHADRSAADPHAANVHQDSA
jgi:hypothetical protein